MFAALLVPALLQAIVMAADERCHRRRDLPRWERLGHPIDTASVAICIIWLLAVPPSHPHALAVFVAGAAVSCAVITKDEWVHARRCEPIEHWLHSALFVLHPIVLGAAGLLWWTARDRWALELQLGAVVALFGFQVGYWNVWRPRRERRVPDQEVYDELGDAWYEPSAHPVALLRAEHALRLPWIDEHLREMHGTAPCRVLDLGCGGGLLANALAERGYAVTGVDISAESLAVAARHDGTGTVHYEHANGYALPFPDASFDAVCAMDFLEHVDAARAVAEASRVLAPGGRFFFYTFDRNWLSWLVVIKGVEWFVKNTPHDLHVLRLFVKPRELVAMCARGGMEVTELVGSRPKVDRAFAKLLATRVVPPELTFVFTRSRRLGYLGVATKRTHEPVIMDVLDEAP